MEEKTKKSSIAGIPYVVILFLIVSTIPSLISDVVTRNKVGEVENKVVKLEAKNPAPKLTLTPSFEPTATPSAAVTLLPTGKGTVVPFKPSVTP